ncbi:hypothetical protein [Amycolatopsis minnesotensis]|uniref:DUF1902 domain-containing protein n=1 Tax=Amycolatopsis minnesotensis TaxID=337894 RepID=A0ABN2SB25_9PSEU
MIRVTVHIGETEHEVCLVSGEASPETALAREAIARSVRDWAERYEEGEEDGQAVCPSRTIR